MTIPRPRFRLVTHDGEVALGDMTYACDTHLDLITNAGVEGFAWDEIRSLTAVDEDGREA